MDSTEDIRAECRVIYERYMALLEIATDYAEVIRLLAEMSEASLCVWDRKFVRPANSGGGCELRGS